MIVEIPQLICCFISTKREIPHDHAAPGAPTPRARPRTTLTVTTHHFSQRHWHVAGAFPTCVAKSSWRTELTH
jgi:hypothetical protein